MSPHASPRSIGGLRAAPVAPSCIPTFAQGLGFGSGEAVAFSGPMRHDRGHAASSSSSFTAPVSSRELLTCSGNDGGFGGGSTQLTSGSTNTSKASTPVHPSSRLWSIAPSHCPEATGPMPSQRNGREQVEALRQKYGLSSTHQQAQGLPLAPREPASLARSVESSVTTSQPIAPQRSTLGFGCETNERRGLSPLESLRGRAGVADQADPQNQRRTRSDAFPENWCGEASMLSRIQAFRRDVLGSAENVGLSRPNCAHHDTGAQLRGSSAPLASSRSVAPSSARASPVLGSWHEAIGAAMSIGGAAVAATVAAAQQGGWAHPASPSRHIS
jgi:hypothetical protein